jgi:short-subunit dehydrogenase
MALPQPDPGSTALVTGASSGIGEQLARQLSARGHHVTLVARRRERLEALAAELGDADVQPTDLADAAQRDQLFAGVTRNVEILVNCAGFGVYEPLVASDRARELQQVRVLVEAVVDLTHRYLPAMVDRGRGAIINLSSTAGFQPLPFNAGYAAAKSHVLLFSEAVSTEVRGTGVTVTAVCPGPVPTEFQETSEPDFADRLPKALWVSPENVAKEALKAADKGKRVEIPGGPHVRAFFGPNRRIPSRISLPVSRRLMRK